MDFNLSKEQQMLAETLHRFGSKEYSFENRRRILESSSGFSREVWSTFAQMGLLSLQVPEEHGGMGAAGIETMLTMQAMGRALVLEPYLESAILATTLIRDLGSSAQKKALLPALAAGESIAVPAHVERGSRYDLSRVRTSAVRQGDGFILNGSKTLVVYGGAADLLIVSARTEGSIEDEAGISLFAIERLAKGISLQTYHTLDERRAADVTFREVQVPAEALLGTLGGAFPALAQAWDLG